MKSLFVTVLLCFLLPVISVAETDTSGEKNAEIRTAVFAGGCFWCMQPPFDALKAKGVLSTSVGYSGGHTKNPTYKQTSAGGTGHFEVIQVTYDAQKLNFKDLLPLYWKNIDPFDDKGQFCDKGEQYSSAIFYANSAEKKDIEDSISVLEKQGIKTENIVTKVLPLKTYYEAEDYHQSYYEKNPIRYNYYRLQCGRDARLKQVWGSSAGH